MIEVSVEVEGKMHKCQVSSDTYECLHGGTLLRKKPMAYYLYCVVYLYEELTEANIIKFMDEKWWI